MKLKDKKILLINSTTKGSSGRIMCKISKTARDNDFASYIAFGRGENNSHEKVIKIGNLSSIYWHVLLTRLSDRHGFLSKTATKKFLKKVVELKPDLIHLHNIHGYYINIEFLFNYIKEKAIPVVWTLHDCWPFTGHCTYFDYVGCNKWMNGCYDCPQIYSYPKSLLIDSSKKNYEKKKELFCGVKNLEIVTPSLWLKDLVNKSFLSGYRVKVINNGVDINIFRPIHASKNDFGIDGDSFVILGVAAKFSRRKGLKYFIELSKMISDNSIIYLAGLNRKQIKRLPKNIIGIKRTKNIEHLVKIYSMADVFVNPTLEDNFPTTNLEALACGTPVITFKTGGSPESIDTNTGIVVEKGDTESLFNAVKTVKNRGKIGYSEHCRKRALEKFNSKDKFNEYVESYEKLLST